MGLIFNGNGDVIRAVDGSLTVEGLDVDNSSTNINAGIATFSGNVNVGGVLKPEDIEWQEKRRQRKVRKLDFEVR